ncbi:MAG: hypothetical protein RL326_1366 [Pseudomonadota bacterium]
MIELFLEIGLQVALELITVWSDDRMWAPRKIPPKIRALGFYVPVVFILGAFSALIAPSPLLVASLNPWLSLFAVPCVASILMVYLCRWLSVRGIVQSELRHFWLSLIVALVFAASRFACLRANVG